MQGRAEILFNVGDIGGGLPVQAQAMLLVEERPLPRDQQDQQERQGGEKTPEEPLG